MRLTRTIPTLAFLAVTAANARAEILMGRVVDSNGNGVPNVDIDVDNLGSGGDPDIFNDGTDANGFFVMTVSEPGVFHVIFNAPPPPSSTALTLTVPDVVTFGTVEMGTLVLPPGVALSGRVLDPNSLPVVNVNIDVIDETTGQRLETPFDRTDVFGNFSIAVPANPIELRLDATTVPGQTLASRAIPLAPTGDTDLGDLQLEQGYVMFGALQSASGLPVVNADFDFIDAETRETLYTPKDNSDSLGLFSVVVPAGVYDVKVCPQPGDLIVAREEDALPILADLPAGILVLEDGFLLSGTVLTSNAVPAAGVDVDIVDSATGATVALCRDDTDATGAYSVVVPTGTLDVIFERRCSGELSKLDVHLGIVITGHTALNGMLPAGPCQGARGNTPGALRSPTSF